MCLNVSVKPHVFALRVTLEVTVRKREAATMDRPPIRSNSVPKQVVDMALAALSLVSSRRLLRGREIELAAELLVRELAIHLPTIKYSLNVGIAIKGIREDLQECLPGDLRRVR
jgi:hypothetical protein